MARRNQRRADGRASGVNFWLGNNPDADGVSPFITEPLAVVDDAVRVQAADAVDADRPLPALRVGVLARASRRRAAAGVEEVRVDVDRP